MTVFFDEILKLSRLVVMGRTMFDVRSSFVRRQKLGVRVRLLTNEHVQCSFDVRSTVRRTFNQITAIIVHVRIIITSAVAELSDQKIKSKVGIFSKVKKSHVFSSNKRQYYL